MAMVCNVVGQEPIGVASGVAVGVSVTGGGVLVGVSVEGAGVVVGVLVAAIGVWVAVTVGGIGVLEGVGKVVAVCTAVGVAVCAPPIASLMKVQAMLSPAAAVMATLF